MNNNFINIIVVLLVLLTLFLGYVFLFGEDDPGLPAVMITTGPTADGTESLEFISLLNQLQAIELKPGVLSELRGTDSVDLSTIQTIDRGRTNPFGPMGTGPAVEFVQPTESVDD